MTSLTDGAAEPLAIGYDTALVDLDGVVYVGDHAVEGAPAALREARDRGLRIAFVTNNAARPPQVVAEHLSRLGVSAEADEVVTSAQAAARLVADMVPAGSAVLVVGGDGLDAALTELGLRPVRSADDEPRAVVQGFAPEVGWKLLAEGTFAVARGLPWVASNLDRTLPTSRGLAPGNGALVGVIAAATGAVPQVAGKPETPLHEEALRRSGARRPVVVGDRLDTDIDGANRAGCDSLLVLTGVSRPADVLRAPTGLRPSYVAEDLASGLLAAHPPVAPTRGGWVCRGWCAQVVDGRLRLTGDGERIDALRALAAATWHEAGGVDASGVDETLATLGW